MIKIDNEVRLLSNGGDKRVAVLDAKQNSNAHMTPLHEELLEHGVLLELLVNEGGAIVKDEYDAMINARISYHVHFLFC